MYATQTYAAYSLTYYPVSRQSKPIIHLVSHILDRIILPEGSLRIESSCSNANHWAPHQSSTPHIHPNLGPLANRQPGVRRAHVPGAVRQQVDPENRIALDGFDHQAETVVVAPDAVLVSVCRVLGAVGRVPHARGMREEGLPTRTVVVQVREDARETVAGSDGLGLVGGVEPERGVVLGHAEPVEVDVELVAAGGVLDKLR